MRKNSCDLKDKNKEMREQRRRERIKKNSIRIVYLDDRAKYLFGLFGDGKNRVTVTHSC